MPPLLLGQIEKEQVPKLARSMERRARELMAGMREHHLQELNLAAAVRPAPGWREEAARWLRLEGVSNQGRVRSDNIAPYNEDGLLFRSGCEIALYYALKAAGLTFAPLPVVLRGGAGYRRIEPDFVVFYEGQTLVIEVDGGSVHVEAPADAHARLRLMTDHGAEVERVKASECDDEAKARRFVAERILPRLKQLRRIR